MASRMPWFQAYPAQHETPAWSVIKTCLIPTLSSRTLISLPARIRSSPFLIDRVLDYQTTHLISMGPPSTCCCLI